MTTLKLNFGTIKDMIKLSEITLSYKRISNIQQSSQIHRDKKWNGCHQCLEEGKWRVTI